MVYFNELLQKSQVYDTSEKRSKVISSRAYLIRVQVSPLHNIEVQGEKPLVLLVTKIGNIDVFIIMWKRVFIV